MVLSLQKEIEMSSREEAHTVPYLVAKAPVTELGEREPLAQPARPCKPAQARARSRALARASKIESSATALLFS